MFPLHTWANNHKWMIEVRIWCTYTANSHAWTSKGPKSRLSTRSRSFGFVSTSSPKLYMQSSNTKFLYKCTQQSGSSSNNVLFHRIENTILQTLLSQKQANCCEHNTKSIKYAWPKSLSFESSNAIRTNALLLEFTKQLSSFRLKTFRSK